MLRLLTVMFLTFVLSGDASAQCRRAPVRQLVRTEVRVATVPVRVTAVVVRTDLKVATAPVRVLTRVIQTGCGAYRR